MHILSSSDVRDHELQLHPENLRVLRCYQRLPPEPGGMEQHIAALTKGQRDLGVEVINVHQSGISIPPSVKVLAEIRFSRIRSQFLRDVLFYGSVFSQLDEYLDEKLNILHIHGDLSAFFLAAGLLRRRVNAQLLVASVHGQLTRPPKFYRSALSQYGLIAATGAVDAQNLTKWMEGEVFHFPSGIADEFFVSTPTEQTCDVIAVGNLLPNKQTEILIQCAALRPDVRFSIYGDGPERAKLEALRLRAGCSNLQFYGKASREVVAHAMRGARVFVNVSQSEGTPTSVLEAMAVGLPVVLTPANDYRWLIKNRGNGILTPDWSTSSIISGINWYLEDETRLQLARIKNVALAQYHRWPEKARHMTKRMLAALTKSLRGGGSNE